MAMVIPPFTAAFDALFPSPSSSAPTPVATPSFGFVPEGQPFGSEAAQSSQTPAIQHSSHARTLIALSNVKRFLSNVCVLEETLSPDAVRETKKNIASKAPKDLLSSLELLLAEWPDTSTDEEDLVEWYMMAIRTDFLQNVAPGISDIWLQTDEKKLVSKLQKTGEILFFAQQIYSFPVIEYMVPALLRASDASDSTQSLLRTKLTTKFSKSLHPIFIDSLPGSKVYDAVTTITLQSCTSIFRLRRAPSKRPNPKYELHHEASLQLMQLFENLKHVGLGDDSGVRAFAKAIEEVIVRFVQSEWMEVDWAHQTPVITNLVLWVEKALGPFIKRAVSCLTGDAEPALDEEMKRWLDMAIAWLGRSRISNLFEFVCHWPESQGAILDIKAYIKTPEARKYLTLSFQHDIERRLLHAGATSKHILDVYMLIIQAFTTIDGRGVLLDNVSRPIRKYLKGRTDTARIIISSMLADPEDAMTRNSPDVSKAVAEEMNKPISAAGEFHRQDHDLDYDNMNYLPHPNDASPDFKRSESNDTIAHLLSLYDREQFVSVLKNILGEHLLRSTDDMHLERETHLLELFKSRFGEERLQACEVMLQDITNSRRMHKKITQLPEFTKAASSLPVAGSVLTTQILSSFFWPEMRDDEFSMPKPIQHLQKLYEQGFESHHNMMKLRWLPSLGRATVELHFADRVVTENVPPWVASVAYAFDGSDASSPVSKSIQQLTEELDMEETLVRNAVSFWVGKQVLEETDEGVFSVLETLPDESQRAKAKMPSAMVVPEEVSAVKTGQDIFDENADMYKTFIQAMLMNAGAMPMARILMMLKFTLPVGFPYGETELNGLLQGMVQESKLLQDGETYGVRK